MAKFSPKEAKLFRNGVSVGLSDIRLEIDNADVDATDLDSGGARELLEGLYKFTITATGPFNSGKLLMVPGGFYTLTFRLGGSGATEVAFTGTVKFSNHVVTANVKNNNPVEQTCRFESSGPFTPIAAA